MALLADGVSPLLIDGKLTSGSQGTFPTINPATEEVLGVAADADAEDMGRAIEAARRAFDDTDWSRNTELRVRCIRQLRDAMREHVEELRDITIAEVGAPRMLTAVAQLEGPVDDLSFAADTAEIYQWNSDLGDASPMGIPTRRTVAREAVGVVGAITPWNFPHQINLAKLGPALAAGNTVVLKPAPDTPWCAAVLGELITEHTDFPPGVVNIVTSSDHSVGALLAKDPRVDMVSFTGSTATGRSVMSDAAVDPQEGVPRTGRQVGVRRARRRRSERRVLGLGVHRLHARRAGLRDHHPAASCHGPNTTRPSRSRQAPWARSSRATPTSPEPFAGQSFRRGSATGCRATSTSAIAEGGTFACGGGRPADRDTGFFIEPTVIAGLDNDARPAREEIFGPVLTVIAHDGDDDALRIANDSPYGLSGTVFSADPERAAKFAARIRVGTVNVNGGVWYSADAPFGGYKQSGNGREMGLAGFEEYLETKTIATAV